MVSNKFVLFFSLAVLAGSTNCGVLPAAPAYAVAPAPIAYHHAVPYNIPPYADRVDFQSRVLSVPVAPAVHAVAPAVHAVAPAVHGLAPAVHGLAPAVPALASAYAPHVHAVAPHLHAVAPSIHAVAPAVHAVAPHVHAAPALGHIPAPLALPHALPAAIPAPHPAAVAYGHPALGAPVWRR